MRSPISSLEAMARTFNLIWISVLLVPCVLCADTAPHAGPKFGWDDTNFAVLNPWYVGTSAEDPSGPGSVLTSSWPGQASGHGLDKNGNLIDEMKWTFIFAQDSTVIYKDDFRSIVYTPWVVEDPGVKIPGGKYTNPDHGDVGGVDFSFVYTPKVGDIGFGDLKDVHFLQVVRTITVYGNDLGGPVRAETSYFVDNLGSNSTPFADQVGANSQLPNGGGVKNKNGTVGKFFFDVPDRCEPYPYGYGDPDCMKDQDPSLLFIDWEAQTFVAVGNPTAANDVTLYGGLWWGFSYVNADVPAPEPSSLLLLGSGVLGLSGFLRKRLLTRS